MGETTQYPLLGHGTRGEQQEPSLLQTLVQAPQSSGQLELSSYPLHS